MNNKPIFIGIGSVIDSTPRTLVRYPRGENKNSASKFGKNVWIGAHCIVGRNVSFEDGVILSDGTYVENNVVLGKDTLLTYRCLVCSDSVIGDNCVIGGFIGENSQIGSSSRVFGSILHHHLDPTKDWDAPSSMEEGATLKENVFIGFGARITKPITISNNVYVCPNSIVSVDVPPYHVVKGVNEIIPSDEWIGKLSKSNFFRLE